MVTQTSVRESKSKLERSKPKVAKLGNEDFNDYKEVGRTGTRNQSIEEDFESQEIEETLSKRHDSFQKEE